VNDYFYLDGKWDVEAEKAISVDTSTRLVFKFNAKEVYLVAEADVESEADIIVDGVKTQTIKIKDSKLYHIVSLPISGSHKLEVIFKNSGTRIYAFTFG
jgi:gamma-glutamyl phosphate reductase